MIIFQEEEGATFSSSSSSSLYSLLSLFLPSPTLYAFVDSVLQTPTTWKFRQLGMRRSDSMEIEVSCEEWRDKMFREEHVRRCNFLRVSRLWLKNK